MDIMILSAADSLWSEVSTYAAACSWHAGAALSQHMNSNGFTDWERVIVALEQGKICGFCTVSKTDCIPDVPYSPYIGFVFVDEGYRGARLSEQMIRCAMDYLRTLGFHEVYLVSDHVNLYEKYGFQILDRKLAPWGTEEKIYTQSLRK